MGAPKKNERKRLTTLAVPQDDLNYIDTNNANRSEWLRQAVYGFFKNHAKMDEQKEGSVIITCNFDDVQRQQLILLSNKFRLSISDLVRRAITEQRMREEYETQCVEENNISEQLKEIPASMIEDPLVVNVPIAVDVNNQKVFQQYHIIKK